MARSQPYQPLALRTLHGSIAALIIIALLTGVLIYNIYDHRLGHLPIIDVPRIMGIHKLFGRAFLLIIPFFALYSFDAGRRRLVQSDSLDRLKEIGLPIWWYTFHRIVNTFMLLGATLALVSGRIMDEGWMSRGELTHVWYSIHLISWVIMFGSLAIHLLMIARVGGVPLMLSIFQIAYRPNDRPSMLIKSFQSWFSPKRLINWLNSHLIIQKHNMMLLAIELMIMSGIIWAWISLIPHRV